ncbi:hypothetical protein [Nonomuraea africana]|uniref:hypothetical protein n=1 Tax=Nonomuraea africana TaxID=46171 RepID=UPI0033F40199
MTTTLIHGVRLFDGDGVTPRADVVIRDHLIDRVTASDGEPEGTWDVLVDGAGHTLLPGLIDAHAHAHPGSLAQALRFGITTELDMFSVPRHFAPLRAQAAERDDVADVRTAGVGANAEGGHPAQFMREVFGEYPAVRGPQDAEAFVAGDPTTDITDTRSIAAIWRRGVRQVAS